MKPPLSLSDRSLGAVIKTAEMLPVSQRDTYLQSVANRLADQQQPEISPTCKRPSSSS